MLITDYYTINSKTEKDGKTIFLIQLNADSDVYNGHFPNNPVSPGVCNVQMIVECASLISGVELTIKSIKRCRFLNVVKPSDNKTYTIEIELEKIDNGFSIIANMLDDNNLCIDLKACGDKRPAADERLRR